MEQDVGWIFRSGNAERREAMQRIVDRSDAQPGYAPASAQAGRRQWRDCYPKKAPTDVAFLFEKSINAP